MQPSPPPPKLDQWNKAIRQAAIHLHIVTSLTYRCSPCIQTRKQTFWRDNKTSRNIAYNTWTPSIQTSDLQAVKERFSVLLDMLRGQWSSCYKTVGAKTARRKRCHRGYENGAR